MKFKGVDPNAIEYLQLGVETFSDFMFKVLNVLSANGTQIVKRIHIRQFRAIMELFGAFSPTAKLDKRIEDIIIDRAPSEQSRNTESAIIRRKEKKNAYNKNYNATVRKRRREEKRNQRMFERLSGEDRGIVGEQEEIKNEEGNNEEEKEEDLEDNYKELNSQDINQIPERQSSILRTDKKSKKIVKKKKQSEHSVRLKRRRSNSSSS